MNDDDFRFGVLLALVSCGIFLWLIYERLCRGLVHMQVYELPKPVAKDEKTE